MEVLPSFKNKCIPVKIFSPEPSQTFQKSMQFLPKKQSDAQTESSRKGVFSNGRHSSKNAMKNKHVCKMQFHRQFQEIQSDGVQTLPVIFSHNLMRREASSFWLKSCLEFEFLFGVFFQELLDSSVPENCLCIRIL